MLFFDFTWKKFFCSRKWWVWRDWRPPAPPPPTFLYGPDRLSVLKKIGISKHLLKSKNIAEVNAVARDSCCKQCLIYYTHFSNQISPF